MALTLTPLSFTGKVGQALSVTFTAGGGVAPYTYSSADAPTDLTFTLNVLGGTPSVGFYTLTSGIPVAKTFTVHVVDSTPGSALEKDFTLSALITATNLVAIPAWKNIASYEQDVPTDSGATIRVTVGKYVVGTYYTFLSLHPDKWEYLADSSSLTAEEITYINTPNLTGNLMTVSIPAHPAASGYKGQIAIDGTTIFVHNGTTWLKGTLATFSDNSTTIPELYIYKNRKAYEVDYMTSDGYFARIPKDKAVIWACENYTPYGESQTIVAERFLYADWELLADTVPNRALAQVTDYGFFGYHRLVGIPLTTTSSGYPGNIAYDRPNSKIYLCTAANTWACAPLATF
jgi:hypothetical protein